MVKLLRMFTISTATILRIDLRGDTFLILGTFLNFALPVLFASLVQMLILIFIMLIII